MDQEVIDALRKEIVARVHNQKKWLTAMTVALPPDQGVQDWAAAVQQVLFDLHIDNVDITVDDGQHEAPWVRTAELGGGWA